MRRRALLAAMPCAGAALALVIGACGGSSDSATASNSRFCDLARQLDAQEDFPSADQLKRYRDAAPVEIRSDVRAVVARFLASIDAGTPEAPYSDPGIEAAFAPIDTYEADVCGIEERD